MSSEIDALRAEVARNTEIDKSAIALLSGLAARIESMKTDPVALQDLVDTMRGSSDALAAAVLANTAAMGSTETTETTETKDSPV